VPDALDTETPLGRNGVAHHRDSDRGAETVARRNGRIPAGECHVAARVSGRQVNIGD